MNKIKNITIGCDPEVFLEKDGVIISAVGKIGGTKKAPQKISDNGHAIQEDNVAIEWNIPPCKTKEEFVENNNFVKDYLNALLELMGCKLNFSASAILSDEELDSEQAQEFGCSPDFDVYKKEANEPPESGGNMRVCGGHIAVGWDNPTEEQAMNLVKAMDVVLGLKSLFLDKDTERKKMYGKAGCFRFTDFGVEYRTLSNFWTENDELMAWAFTSTIEAIELVNSEKLDDIQDLYSDLIVEAINTNNKELAEVILESVGREELIAI